jgi:hypothetical protein
MYPKSSSDRTRMYPKNFSGRALQRRSHSHSLDNLRSPKVPAGFAAKCFPDLLRHGASQSVQLHIAEVTEDGVERAPIAAGESW